MSSRAARGLPGVAAARRERVERERTAAQLRRQEALEAEVVEQLEPLLGPAGRPVGETAMALWRRRRVDAYLALPPWQRAWRTWMAWGRVRRGLAVLGAGLAWTLLLLPLRIFSLASLEASQAGVAIALIAAPIVALLPPARRGRFVDPLPAGGAPWRRSRRAGVFARTLVLVGLLVVAVVAVLAMLGPGVAQPPQARITAAARAADLALIREAVAIDCGSGVETRVTPVNTARYRVTTAAGAASTVEVSRDAGFTSGVRHVIPIGGPIACTAP